MKPTIESVCDVLRSRLDVRGDLLSVMPFGRRVSAAFIERHQDEIEQCIGKRLRVVKSSYTPNGRGAFGRMTGRRDGVTRSRLSIFWA